MDNNRKEKLSGVFPPSMTCFENEEVSYDKIAKNIEKYNSTRIKGYMPLGSNGEFKSLTDEESVKIIEVYAKYKAKDKVMIAGAARESAKTTLEFIKKIADKGVDFATLLPPFYFVNYMTDDVLLKYFTTIADKSPVPIMVYNAPKFAAGLNLTPSLISKLALHPNIAGMKDTSKEDIKIYCDAVPANANFYVLAGTINKFYKGLLLGAIGGVLSIANYLPELCCDLHQAFLDGKTDEAARLDVYSRTLSDNAAGKFGVAGVKAAMDALGYFGGDPRLPLEPLPQSEKDNLRAVLKKENLL